MYIIINFICIFCNFLFTWEGDILPEDELQWPKESIVSGQDSLNFNLTSFRKTCQNIGRYYHFMVKNISIFNFSSFLQAGKSVANWMCWCSRRRCMCLRVSVTRSRVCPKVKNRKEVSWHSASEEQQKLELRSLLWDDSAASPSLCFFGHTRARASYLLRPEARFLSFFRVDDSQNAAKCVNRALHAKMTRGDPRG